MIATAMLLNRSASNHNKHEVAFSKPLVLSFSACRYGALTTFGEFIMKAMLKKGLKQSELARVVGVDEMTVANWEQYKTIPRTVCELLDSDSCEIA